MHSSFAALRNEMPMNVRKRDAAVAGGPSAACVKDIARVAELWAECRAAVAAETDGDGDVGRGGDDGFLFGTFSIADEMFAPVAMRFLTYNVELDATAAAYVQTIAAMPEWCSGALRRRAKATSSRSTN